MTGQVHWNSLASPVRSVAIGSDDPLAFHRGLPGYMPTPLVEAPSIADRLGVGEVWIKDESSRIGLPSFKILGASWAVFQAVSRWLGEDLDARESLDEVAERLALRGQLTLVAATDGNHGRAVARMAALLGSGCSIFVPEGTVDARIASIEDEGAKVTVVEGDYDDAVRRSTEDASEQRLVISDTSWPGYTDVPTWIIEGYATIFHEVQEQLSQQGHGCPTLVGTQVGVGAFAAAAVSHFRRPSANPRPTLVAVEPVAAACLLRSMQAGEIVSVPGPHRSIMAGLNCGTPSLIAWPLLSAGIDVAVAIEDERTSEAMRLLAQAGVVSGESGAAGLGGLLELASGVETEQARVALGLDEATRVLLVSTEGVTDPAAYEAIVGERPQEV